MKCGEGMIDEWNQHLRGDVWSFDVALYELQKDIDSDAIKERDYYERHGKAISEDSCWGFYGSDYVLTEAKSIAECQINSLGKKAE